MLLPLYNYQNIVRSTINARSILRIRTGILTAPRTLSFTPLQTTKCQFHASSYILNDLKAKGTNISRPKVAVKPELPVTPLKTALSENIYTVPNFLTLTRIITTPAIGYFIVTEQPNLAISVFVYSCVTDFVDGYIARRFNMKSVVGSIMDPMADKLLMTVSTISLSYMSIMPLYLAGLIIGRDVMLSFMGIYYRYITLPPPKTITRYLDFSIPTVSVHPNLLSKVNTGLQMVYIGSLVLQPAIEALMYDDWIGNFHLALQGFEILVATTTFLSGCTYVFSKNAIKFIK